MSQVQTNTSPYDISAQLSIELTKQKILISFYLRETQYSFVSILQQILFLFCNHFQN